MDLSPEDRERLDRLMEQHLNGQLSDDEYQRRSWEILRGTDSGAGSRAALRAQGQSASVSQTVSESELEALGSKPSVKRRRKLSETLLPLILVFAFGIALALIIGVLKSGARPNPIDVAHTGGEAATPFENTIEQAAENLAGLFFRPRFGPDALKYCKEACVESREGTARKACLRDCSHLKLSKYGRRVSLIPLDASHDARAWVAACLTNDLSLRRHSSAIGWEEELESSAYLLSRVSRVSGKESAGTLQTLYDRLLLSIRTLRAPPGGEKQEQDFTEQMARVSCLRAGSLISAFAKDEAKRRSDQFSARYFERYKQELDEAANAREPLVLKQAATLGLYSNE